MASAMDIDDDEVESTSSSSKGEKKRFEVKKASMKRNIDGQPTCACRKDCTNRNCSCLKLNMTCTGNCKCNNDSCKNKSSATTDDALEEDDEDLEEKGRRKGLRSGKKGNGKKRTPVSSTTKVPTLKIKLRKRRQASSGEEGDESHVGTDRDSDAEFEQMLQEAEQASVKDGGSDEAPAEDSATPEAPKKKAKTKIGNKSKKMKTKTTSKSPSGEGQDGYEDTLALQKSSKDKRSCRDNAEKVHNWVTQEFTTILNSLEAERTLKNLMEGRSSLAKKLLKLQDSLNEPNIETRRREKINSQIKSLNEDLELKSSQIMEIKQQQQSLESFREDKSKNRWDFMQTMADAKLALTQVLDTASKHLSDLYKDKSSKEAELNELQGSYNEVLEQLQEKDNLLKEQSEKLRLVETEYNDETPNRSHVWNAVMTPNTGRKFYEDDDFEYDSESDTDQEENPISKKVKAVINYKTPKRSYVWNAVVTRRKLYEDDDDDNFEYGSENDPDWEETPSKKLRVSRDYSKDEEGDESHMGTDRDSDAEFEQMLQEAEEASVKDGGSDEAPAEDSPTPEVPKKKIKTKIGIFLKKKKKTNTTSKFSSV